MSASKNLPQALAQEYPHLALGVQRGWLTVFQVDEALAVQQAAEKAGLNKTLDEILMRKNYIMAEKLQALREAVAPEKSAPKMFGDYAILAKLGEGMMGKVYKVRHVPSGRIQALKILTPDLAKDRSMLERFLREARAMLKLKHPHIVIGFEVGCVKKLNYIAMEFVDGPSLDLRLKREGKLAEVEALEIARQVALGLDHAHQAGYLHRDVKPENVLLGPDGKAKLADLGLSRALNPGQGDKLTAEGATVGSPNYISPEQAQGLAELTPATDVYSLGVMLFECLTGQVPFDDEEFYVVMLKHVNDPPPDPRGLNPELSEASAQLVLKLMSKDPQGRGSGALQTARELEAILAGLRAPASKTRSVNANAPPRGGRDWFGFK